MAADLALAESPAMATIAACSMPGSVVGPRQRLAAIDIGSGCTKMMVVEVDTAAGHCERVLLECEVPVLYGMDSRRSPDGHLSEEVQQHGLKVLAAALKEAAALQPNRVAAVATEVFRRAPNGRQFVGRIRAELGLDVAVVDQPTESLLGFNTAAAMAQVPRRGLISWDCGGASFQLAASAADGAVHGDLRMHLGAVGDAVATAAMVELRGRRLAEVSTSPNPVTLEEAKELIAIMRDRIPAPPEWLRGASGVVAVGGKNSMFCLLADIMQRPESWAGEEGGDRGEGRDASSSECPDHCDFVAADVWAALERVVDLGDDELLRRWCWRPNSDPPSMVVPKLCLILASLETFELAEVKWRRTVGNCAGLALSNICCSFR